MVGHLRSQRTTKLQIFTSWSLFAPTVGAVRGEDAVHSTLLVIGWSTFLPPSPWRAQAIRLALAHWSFPYSHLLGCGFHPSSSHPRPSSSKACISSPTGSACYTSARRQPSRHPSEGRPPSALGHPMTSMTRHLRFIPSKLFAQTPL